MRIAVIALLAVAVVLPPDLAADVWLQSRTNDQLADMLFRAQLRVEQTSATDDIGNSLENALPTSMAAVVATN